MCFANILLFNTFLLISNAICPFEQVPDKTNKNRGITAKKTDTVYVRYYEGNGWFNVRFEAQIGIYPWRWLVPTINHLKFEVEVEAVGEKVKYEHCSFCGLYFESVPDYNSHVHAYEDGNCSEKIRCLNCSTIFYNKTQKDRHNCDKKRHKFVRTCPICGDQFTQRRALFKHRQVHVVPKCCVRYKMQCHNCTNAAAQFTFVAATSEENEEYDVEEKSRDDEVTNRLQKYR